MASVDTAEFVGVAIEPEVNSDTYDRDNWKHWSDADGVRMHDEVLASEGLGTIAMDGVKVRGGLWAGPGAAESEHGDPDGNEGQPQNRPGGR